MGSSRRFSPICSKKRVESAGTVVQGYVGGLLRLGGEPGWGFVSKCAGEQLCVKGDLGVGSYSKNRTAREPSWKQVGLPSWLISRGLFQLSPGA